MKERMRDAGILNGCGGKGSLVPVPDFFFTASCDHHDFNYWLGGTEADRRKADWEFYRAMLLDATWWWEKFVAYTYYKAVRVFAKSYFHYGPERTWKDLYEAVGFGSSPDDGLC